MKKLVPIVVVLLGLALVVYFGKIRPSRLVDPAVRGSGSIEATTVVVSSELAARILTLAAAEGDPVTAGQVLATLQCDQPEARHSQAKATLAQAQAGKVQAAAAAEQAEAQRAPLGTQEKLAGGERDRVRALFASAGATQRTLDQAESAYQSVSEQAHAAARAVDVAKSAVKVATAQVEVAEKALALAETVVAECTLTAPIDGVVLERNYEPGELVLPGSSLLKLGRLDEVHTWIYVPNQEIGRVKIGEKVKVAADTYPDVAFDGTVARVNQEAEFTPKSIQTKEDRTRLVFGVKVVIPNPEHKLLPGMPVEAVLVEAPPSQAAARAD